jgi:hypothetical protein
LCDEFHTIARFLGAELVFEVPGTVLLISDASVSIALSPSVLPCCILYSHRQAGGPEDFDYKSVMTPVEDVVKEMPEVGVVLYVKVPVP